MNFLKVFFLILFFSTNSAFAAKAYFDVKKIDQNLIDPPFEIGDEKWQNEVEIIIKTQSNYDKERIVKAALEKELRGDILALRIDKNLQRKNFPKLYLLLDRVGETSYELARHFKDHYKITRPYLASEKIKNLIPASKGYSYPSGHTSGSYIYAYVLMMVFADKKEELLKIAAQIADNRILIGMHYPQDIKAGKQLALLAVGALTQNAEFLQDLEAARSESRQGK